MDLSKISTSDLKAFQSGDLATVSTEGLKALTAAPAPDPRAEKIDKYLAETDTMLGFTPGTSARQINQESRFDSAAFNKGSKAAGIAQVIPGTVATLSARMGRKLDPHNDDDALLMHRELMWENKNRFVNQDDALRAYNAGWDKKRWDNTETNNYISVVSAAEPSATPQSAAQAPVDPKLGYTPFAVTRKKVDPASLNADADWIRASKQLYNLRERKHFEGADSDAGEWGKEFMGWFESNSVQMARYAKDVITNGSDDDKRAMVYMMETADNLNYSWEGTGRFFKGALVDPLNIASVASLGIGGVAKSLAATAAKAGLKKALVTSLGRTGIVAGIDTGIQAGATNAVKQNVKVDAGAQDSFSAGELAVQTGVGVVAGVVLGTAADAAATAIINAVRRNLPKKATSGPRIEPTLDAAPTPAPAAAAVPEGAPVAPAAVAPNGAAAAVPGEAAVLPGAPAKAAEPDLLPATLLTEAELKAGTGRQQEGRLWVDDLPPVHPANKEVGELLDIPATGQGLRSTPRTNADTQTAGEVIVNQLRNLPDSELAGVLEHIRLSPYTKEEHASVDAGVMLYAKEMIAERLTLMKGLGLSTNAKETTEMVARLAAVEARITPLELANDAMGSMAGSVLQQRKMDPFHFKGVTPESLAAEKGISLHEAEGLFVQMHEGAAKDAATAKVDAAYEKRIEEAMALGDNAEAARLQVMKVRERDALAEQTLPGSASFMHKAAEWVISAVFSPSTIVVNILAPALKTIFRPFLHAVVTDPLKAASRAEMIATYSAMKSTFGAAMRAARTSFLFEQSLLTRGTGRLMEGELAIEGRKGGVIRLLPRILGATDEFLSQINYNGFVAGRAAADAMTEGQAKGMTGKLLEDYVKLSAEIAMKEAFQQTSGEALIQPLVNKGVNLGLTGDALLKYVEKHAVKHAEQLRHGSDHQALEMTRDVLYKRDFSGGKPAKKKDGTDGKTDFTEGASSASALAKAYQDMTNKVPALKLLLGQLFFRTPVRVFEEGIRLTPGLQLIAPGFVPDLMGKNGVARQARAQAEALTSVAITGAIVSLYASGKITGDGAHDNWKQGRTAADGPGQPALSIKMADGSSWVYRSLDPISTPFKIIVNGLERMDKLAMRQAQGEFINATAWDQAQAYVTVGTTAIGAALRDANLTAGVGNMMKLAENLNDPEGKEDAWLKFFGEKLAWAVPNTFTKIAKQNDPTLKDPADFWQVVESKLAALHVDFADVKTSYSYDVLGNVRTIADTGALWNMFSTDTPLEQSRGMSPDAQAVMLELARLQKETGAIFAPPLRSALTGDFDPRTVLTADKSETIYDRWQRNYRDLDPVAQLHAIATADMPDGTRGDKGLKAELLQSTMNKLRTEAYQITMDQEEKVFNAYIEKTIRGAEAKSGMLDFRIRDK